MWNHFRSKWLMLTGLQIPTGPPFHLFGLFSVNSGWGGKRKYSNGSTKCLRHNPRTVWNVTKNKLFWFGFPVSIFFLLTCVLYVHCTHRLNGLQSFIQSAVNNFKWEISLSVMYVCIHTCYVLQDAHVTFRDPSEMCKVHKPSVVT